ncbi:MAG: hypothetical protein ABS87_01040 [Sphingomonas sp. SCN 67-18]|nr:hypothetical protein [Sphingomonas sp. SCN 67-18]ODU22784.1 MAG: hypothetical protein ABS87_01040 [Sphingomonas sp. SCN 67-18]
MSTILNILAAASDVPPTVYIPGPSSGGFPFWVRAMAAGAGFALGGALLDEYRTWKRNRTELVISKDWRGRPVVDRKLRLFERAFTWTMIVLFLLGLTYSVWSLLP